MATTYTTSPLLYTLPNGKKSIFFSSLDSCLSLSSSYPFTPTPSWSFSIITTAALTPDGGYIFGTVRPTASPALISKYNTMDFEYYGCSAMCQRFTISDTDMAGKNFHHIVVVKSADTGYITTYFDGSIVYNTTITV